MKTLKSLLAHNVTLAIFTVLAFLFSMGILELYVHMKTYDPDPTTTFMIETGYDVTR